MKKVLCIHGFNSHLDFMHRLLPDGYICINNTSYMSKIFDVEECIQFWQEEYRKVKEIHDDIILVAHSFGCFAALHLDSQDIQKAFLLTPFFSIHLREGDNLQEKGQEIRYLETSRGKLAVTAGSYRYVHQVNMQVILADWNVPTILCTASNDVLTSAEKTNSCLVDFGGKVTSLQVESNHFLEGAENEVKRIISEYA